MMKAESNRLHCPARERGASLVVVMMVLLVVTVAGIAGARLALLGEMSARHDRDTQIAFEAAEAAIVDAENEIDGLGASACTALRGAQFLVPLEKLTFADGTCGTTTGDRGLCKAVTSNAVKPTWAVVDFLDNSSTAPTTAYGAYTCRTFDAGSGLKSARPPRYMIEWVQDRAPGAVPEAVVFRITAMGFGPRVDTRTVLQVEYRKRATE